MPPPGLTPARFAACAGNVHTQAKSPLDCLAWTTVDSAGLARWNPIHPPRRASLDSHVCSTHLDADILAVQDWLDGHHAETLTIDGLAQQFGYSSRTLKRRFALATGSSPNKYLQEIRIAKAKKLLSLSDLSSKEIAYAVGYDNHCHFSRLFKRHCGLTPMEWKHRHAPAHSGE